MNESISHWSSWNAQCHHGLRLRVLHYNRRVKHNQQKMCYITFGKNLEKYPLLDLTGSPLCRTSLKLSTTFSGQNMMKCMCCKNNCISHHYIYVFNEILLKRCIETPKHLIPENSCWSLNCDIKIWNLRVGLIRWITM